METCFNYCDKDAAFFSSDERRWINKIRKLKEQHPDKVTILQDPETNDGCIYCQLPSSWLRIQPKRETVLTDEEKALIYERLTRGSRVSSELPDE